MNITAYTTNQVPTSGHGLPNDRVLVVRSVNKPGFSRSHKDYAVENGFSRGPESIVQCATYDSKTDEVVQMVETYWLKDL